MSATLRRIDEVSDFDRVMSRRIIHVPRVVAWFVVVALAIACLYGAYAFVRDAYLMPTVYESYATHRIVKIEIGSRTFSPSDLPPERVKEILSGRYNHEWAK